MNFYDLDNTLLDFMRMKEIAVKAAIKGMIEAGLKVDESKSYKENWNQTKKKPHKEKLGNRKIIKIFYKNIHC